jgi:hypothetical protein
MVKPGLWLIVIGVGTAAVYQHLDSLVFGGLLVIVGLAGIIWGGKKA